MPFLKYKRLKLKLRVLLSGHSVAMVTYCVTKIITMCSPMIGQFFDTMIVASTDKESGLSIRFEVDGDILKVDGFGGRRPLHR